MTPGSDAFPELSPRELEILGAIAASASYIAAPAAVRTMLQEAKASL